jgi:hypothetical protein
MPLPILLLTCLRAVLSDQAPATPRKRTLIFIASNTLHDAGLDQLVRRIESTVTRIQELEGAVDESGLGHVGDGRASRLRSRQ